MSALADPVGAVVAVLDLNDNVAALAQGRVYGGELPDDLTKSEVMPTYAVLVTRAGGSPLQAASYLPFSKPRLDIRAYGAEPYDASQLGQAVNLALTQLRPVREVGTRVLSAEAEAVGSDLRDPQTEWPFQLSTWRVTVCDIAN